MAYLCHQGISTCLPGSPMFLSMLHSQSLLNGTSCRHVLTTTCPGEKHACLHVAEEKRLQLPHLLISRERGWKFMAVEPPPGVHVLQSDWGPALDRGALLTVSLLQTQVSISSTLAIQQIPPGGATLRAWRITAVCSPALRLATCMTPRRLQSRCAAHHGKCKGWDCAPLRP